MKRILFSIMASVMLLALAGCDKVTVKNGTEAAKILLANERLDEAKLKSEGTIFTSGAKAFKKIKDTTAMYSEQDFSVKLTSYAENNTYVWDGFADYSNFLDYFKSYSDNIEFNAKSGADLIDSTKKNIKIVNTWIKISRYEEILLLVDEDSETILSRSDSQYEICRRKQNDLGQNVFEMFIHNSDTNSKSRMTYIPGLRYEFTMMSNDDILVIVADKDKGYWDIMSTVIPLENQESISFTNLVMKDEAIYENSYVLFESNGEKYESYNRVELVTSDGKSDLLMAAGNMLYLYTTGINGLNKLYLNAASDEVFDGSNGQFPEDLDKYKVYYVGEGNDKQYYTQADSDAIAQFDSGKELKKGDVLYDGLITVSGTTIYPIGGIDFYGNITLRFNTDDINDMLNGLEKLMNDYGFTLKGDYNEIKSSVSYAIQDSVNFSKYYRWQGNNINSMQDIINSIEIEHALVNDFINIYNSVKNNEVVKLRDQGQLSNEYHFSNLTVVSNGSITNSEFNIKIDGLALKAEDTNLFVSNEKYKIEIGFALEEDNEFIGIYRLNSNAKAIEYTGSSFEATLSADISVPTLESGNYTLVAYIATEDGIRVTNPIALTGEISAARNDLNGLANELYSSNGIIKLSSSKTDNINIVLANKYTYDELYEELEMYAYKYGMTANSQLEYYNGTGWLVLDSGADIQSGVYRLAYITNNNTAYIVAAIQ